MILAGGVGSRFWPLSTPRRPKQLLALGSGRPLVVDAFERASTLVPMKRLRILTAAQLVGPISEALSGAGSDLFLVEPSARGTAPVLAWAAHRLRREDPDAVMISLHSDHVIEPAAAFADLLRRTAELAGREGLLFTVGVAPDRPATGYGYIRPGEPLASDGGLRAFRVGSFVEKPGREAAEAYLRDGYLWNTGIFVWRADAFLREVERWAPEVADHLHLLDAGDTEGFFRAVSPATVDVAVLERSDRVATVKADFHWDDVGGWESLGRLLAPDRLGNVAMGEAHLIDASGNIAVSENGAVVLFGVDDMVVVRTPAVTLVTRRERAPDLKGLLDRLPQELLDPET